MKRPVLGVATYAVFGLGAAFHTYLAISRTMTSDFNFIVTPALNLLPYVMCLLLMRFKPGSLIPLCSCILILLTDFYLFRNVLTVPGVALRYAVIGLFTPVWKIVISLPVGCLIGYVLDRLFMASAES